MKAPCYECKDRTVGCHSNCERYKEYADTNEAIKHKVRTEKGELYASKNFKRERWKFYD